VDREALLVVELPPRLGFLAHRRVSVPGLRCLRSVLSLHLVLGRRHEKHRHAEVVKITFCSGDRGHAKPTSLAERSNRFDGDSATALSERDGVLAILMAISGAAFAALRPRANLVLENLVLRQQLAVLRRATPRPHLRPIDRAFWVVVSQFWGRWADALAIVKPSTVIEWHRRGFVRYWAWRSRPVGRPPIGADVIALIERMVAENPTWSRRRIASELSKLGHAVDKNTVAKYMPRPLTRPRRPPSQTWKTFVRNHLPGTIAIDFLTVPTVTFNVLYVFFVLSLDRRRVLHVNVTSHPYAEWAAQQIVEAIGADFVPAYLIRDRDGIYGAAFDARVKHLGIKQVKIAPHSPWQNGYAERWVGTLRRELLDHVIVLGERHLLRLVRQHAAYYNEDRPHMSLDGDAPVTRPIEHPPARRVIALPRIGGLHHRYRRAA
jgi:transposase InsO family protein